MTKPSETTSSRTTVQTAKEKAKTTTYPGWAPLIDGLFDRFPVLAEGESPSFGDKWGSLRCKLPSHLEFQLEGWQDFIEDVERRSEVMCEVCGGPARLRGASGWRHTLCDIHADPADVAADRAAGLGSPSGVPDEWIAIEPDSPKDTVGNGG